MGGRGKERGVGGRRERERGVTGKDARGELLEKDERRWLLRLELTPVIVSRIINSMAITISI